MVSCYQAIAHAHYQLQDYRKALDFQEKAHKALAKLPDVEEQYVKSSKAQMDHFMKLSIYAEKVKNHEKSQRQIGSNKTGAQAPPVEAAKTAEAAQRRGMKPGFLGRGGFAGRQSQKGGNYSVLDLLEYNYIREQQQMLAQKALKEQLEQQQKAEPAKQE